MTNEGLYSNVQAIGRSMRLVSMNIDGPGIPTDLLARSLTSMRDLIDTTLPLIPQGRLMAFDTRLGQHVEELLATHLNTGVPDTIPEGWS
jgi:hypothetical protein